MSRIYLANCTRAVREHQASARQYAHVFHRPNTICVAKTAWMRLPVEFFYAIILHECGHLMFGDHPHTEADADRAAAGASGVRLFRRDWQRQKRLECIAVRDVNKAVEFIDRFMMGKE